MSFLSFDYSYLESRTFLIPALIAVVLSGLTGCVGERQERRISVTDQEAVLFADKLREELSFTLHEDLEISLWASEKLLGDPVDLNFDRFGRAWIATTTRRRTTVPDAGAVSHWFADNLSWRTVEDRREFLRNEVVPENSDRNRWLTDFNGDGVRDWHDMTIERDSVYLLEDMTDDGRANRARVMDWGRYSEATEITGSVLYHEGDLLVARVPDLLRIRDRSGKENWSDVESISYGYGVHLGYSGHGMSGLRVGPAGRIYWAIGDIGVNVVDKRGKRWFYPDAGAILRSDPDGSNFEVFATGLRNVHEFDFDKYGNLIGVDNNGPSPDYDRLVYLVDGSDSGWRIYWQMGKFDDPRNNDYNVWTREQYYSTPFDGQAGHVLPPVSPGYRGPSGFVYNPGTALSGKWKDHFFAASFVGSPARSGVHAFTLKQEGASFERDTTFTVLQGILPTSLDFGTDGSLYATDWIQGWVTKGTGRIWKVDVTDNTMATQRKETRKLLAREFESLQPDSLLKLLSHDDMRVRQRSQFELAGRGDLQTLNRAVEQTGFRLARIHGIWGLAQIGRTTDREAVQPLIEYLADSDPEIRAQAARMLGDVRYEPAVATLLPMLEDANARVRFFAAEALGRMGYGPATIPIIEMIRENRGEDRYLRQAGIIALDRIGDAETLAGLADDPSREVRLAALAALRRLDSPAVVRFLQDNDKAIVTDAARAINDEEFIEEGLPALARMLDQNRFTGEPLLRRAINACLYSAGYENAERLARFSLGQDLPDELKVEALNALSGWADPSVYDRVTGRYRGAISNNPADAREAAEPVIVQLLKDQSEALRIAALETAGNLYTTGAISQIRSLVQDDPSASVRIASLRALHAMDFDNIGEVLPDALNDPDSEVRMSALRVITDLDIPVEKIVSLLATTLESGTAQEKQTAFEILGRLDHPDVYALLERQMHLMINGNLDRSVQLDLIEAVEAGGTESLNDKLRRYRSMKSSNDSVEVYAEVLYGGDEEEGRRIFENHSDAQCFRCHNRSGEAGPDLSGVGTRLTREQLLRALVDPDARIAPGYGSVRVELENDETVRGMLMEENETQLVIAVGGEHRILEKADISGKRYSPSSMPAMGQVLTRNELRDLVEYLSSRRN